MALSCVLSLVAQAALAEMADKPLSDAAKNNSEMMNPASVASFERREGGVKALFLGNSITLHPPYAVIGWTNNWGMAASAIEKDYVHLVARGIERETGRQVDLRVRNIGTFERNFETWDTARELAAEIAFEPDYLVVALGENVKDLGDEASRLRWEKAFKRMVGSFLSGKRRPRVVVRGVFWPNGWKDAAMASAARDCGVPFVRADFGNDPSMKAVGLFAHAGVQMHPGDRGMAEIATRILETLFPKTISTELPQN